MTATKPKAAESKSIAEMSTQERLRDIAVIAEDLILDAGVLALAINGMKQICVDCEPDQDDLEGLYMQAAKVRSGIYNLLALADPAVRAAA